MLLLLVFLAPMLALALLARVTIRRRRDDPFHSGGGDLRDDPIVSRDEP